MTRTLRALVVVLGGGLALVACKKEAEPQAVPVPSGAPAATVAADGTGAAPTDTAAPGATGAAPKPTAAAPQPATPQPRGESIDACCAALAAVKSSGRGADAKTKSAVAARVCQGAAAAVKSGASSRASALVAVRAQLSGVEIPGECQ